MTAVATPLLPKSLPQTSRSGVGAVFGGFSPFQLSVFRFQISLRVSPWAGVAQPHLPVSEPLFRPLGRA